jgi:hypothetical protein
MPHDVLLPLPIVDELLKFWIVYFIDHDPDEDRHYHPVFMCYTDTEKKAACIAHSLDTDEFPCRDYFYELVKDKIIHEENMPGI